MPLEADQIYLVKFGLVENKQIRVCSNYYYNILDRLDVYVYIYMYRLGSDQYTYRTVERRISTASVALGLARMSMPGTQYQLTNLKKFTRYSVVVQAYNVLGQGPMTPEVVATTLEDGKEERLEFFPSLKYWISFG